MKQDQYFTFSRNSFLNQRGQAVIEYVLLLVVIVGMALGAKTAFGHLNDFMGKYMGEYIVCLMEYGELPSLEVADSSQKNHIGSTGKSCDQQFAGFTFVNGRPATGGGGSGGGTGVSSGSGGNGNSNSTSGNKNSSTNASNSGNGKKSSSDSGSGKDSENSDLIKNGGGSKKGSSPYSKKEITRSDGFGTSDGSDSASQKTRVIEEEDGDGRKKKDASGAYSRSRGYSGGSDKYRAITGNMLAEIERNEPKKPRAPSSSITRALADSGFQMGPYKKVFVPPLNTKPEEKAEDNSSFGFGFIIRWLIIGGMILAIIVFFGGQVLNYSNSKD